VINTTLTLISAPQLREFYFAGHWRQDTIYALVRAHAERSPGKTAVRERFRETSYRTLVDAADQLAATLDDRGMRPGQRVAVWLPSRIETAVALLACSRNGYVCAPSLHRDHTVGDVVDLLDRMRATGLIAEQGYGADGAAHDVFESAASIGSLRFSLPLDPCTEESSSQPILADLSESLRQTAVDTDPDSVVYLAFTSGTTGEPKGVMHSDNTLLAPARALAIDWSIDHRSVVYSFSPLSHNLGFGAMVVALTRGAELVVHDLPRGSSLLDRLVDTGTTFAFGVPTHAIDLLTELDGAPSKKLRHLAGFRISGAPIPPSVAEGLLRHDIVPQSGYGMTEAGSHHYTLPGDDPKLIVESSGTAFPGHEAKIFSRDDPDKKLPAGEVGEIGGRGPSLMLGYFGDQAATEAAFNASGYFMTGDVGWMDEAGYIRVTGRDKDVIIRGGHNIFPAKIENLAMRHDAVERAAVVPVADPRLGERVCLAVTVKQGSAVTADELLGHLDGVGLSKFDMPEYFLDLEELPLLPSGKTAKRELAGWIADGRVKPSPVRFTPRA
jgi:acyl-CoA synthetase